MAFIVLPLLWFLYSRIVFPAFLYLGVFLVVTSLLGISTGFHQKYVELLLRVFEYCRRTIERKESQKRARDAESSDEEETAVDSRSGAQAMARQPSLIGDEDKHLFFFSDMFRFMTKGVQAVVDDEVTKRFNAEELGVWNLLTRTDRNYNFSSKKLTAYWAIGLSFRFLILFPIRMIIILYGLLFLLVTTALVGLIPEGAVKRVVYYRVSVTAMRILARGFSGIIRNHDSHYKPKGGGICVANHTSPVDVVLLHCDNAYALVGQLQGGILGLLERSLERATSHIFFNRFEANDRMKVQRKLKEHAEDADKLPILIFPEGTCINNTSIMMFKKGSFEATDTIYPVAIKYDSRFGDPYWDSTKHGFGSYLLMMMTSWAIVCDVWYLPPMTKMPDEPSIKFASRCKAEIARQGGLVDLDWDGQLKRLKVKPEMKAKVQKRVAEKLM